MAKPTGKKAQSAVLKGPPGLTSLTVLFFQERRSFLDGEATKHAETLGLRSATARYVQVGENEWLLRMVFRPRRARPFQVEFPLAPESLRPVDILPNFLAKELMIQARLKSMPQAATDAPLSDAASADQHLAG